MDFNKVIIRFSAISNDFSGSAALRHGGGDGVAVGVFRARRLQKAVGGIEILVQQAERVVADGGGETARIGKGRHQPVRRIDHLVDFAVGIGHRGQVAVGIERKRGHLPVG